MRTLLLALVSAICALSCAEVRSTPGDAMQAANNATAHYKACSGMAGLHYKAAIQRDMGISEPETLESLRASLVETMSAESAARVSKLIVGALHVEQNKRASPAHIASEYMRTCVGDAD